MKYAQMNTASQMLLKIGFSDGDQKISSALSAKGTENHFINGMRLPSLWLHLSLKPATIGSENASTICPMALIGPMTVKTPKKT